MIRIEAGLFIMLVGIVFFYNYRKRDMTGSELLKYFRSRVVYILIPYILWSLIYEVDALYFNTREFDIPTIISNILTGKSMYHLHFISLIVQFYLLFPIFLLIIQKSALLRKYLWIFGVLAEFGYYLLNLKYGFTSGPLFLTILSPFLLGAWIGLHYEKVAEQATKFNSALFGFLFLLTGILDVLIRYESIFHGVNIISPEMQKLLNLAFLMVGGIFFFFLSEQLVKNFKNSNVEKVKRIAYYSFGFYLVHPFIITRINMYLPLQDSGLSWHAMFILHYVLVIVICYFTIWGFHRFMAYSSYLFGKLPKKAVLFWKAS
ncbi:acyltransferase [Metaplanococcus flavidus]|uniref:Acyltransferase n=1 Tax=Metaplanococcus flavidus TaxID=569883 RepID=A0ABW3LBA9_9BACL